MADIRSRSSRQIWITKGHLAALGVTTFFIAVLAFLVGLQIGKKTSYTGEKEALASASPVPLVPDASEEAALEALLREVEFAQATMSPTGELSMEPEGLAFADALSEDPTRLGTDMAAIDDSETTVSPSAGLEIEPPPPITNEDAKPPTSGWAVQVAAYPLVTEADAKVEALRNQDLAAYRVAAVVDGKNWYRVRIGGFESEKDAYTALKELRVRLQQPQLLIASAP